VPYHPALGKKSIIELKLDQFTKTISAFKIDSDRLPKHAIHPLGDLTMSWMLTVPLQGLNVPQGYDDGMRKTFVVRPKVSARTKLYNIWDNVVKPIDVGHHTTNLLIGNARFPSEQCNMSYHLIPPSGRVAPGMLKRKTR
jgi:hypothetical protein